MASNDVRKNSVYADLENATETTTEKEESPRRVGIPLQKPLARDIGHAIKETFFPGDHLKHFKNEPVKRKFELAIKYMFPIVDWAGKYKLSFLRRDIIAGLTIASLCIPQDIGYAKLAHLQPQYGLYTSFVPPLLYALLGSSKHIAIGPVAVVSILLGTLLEKEVDHKKQPELYLRLALTSTFFAGIFQAGLGLLRLGFLIDFLSHAAILGFMAGAAITIAMQQLKGFMGIHTFTTKTDIIAVMKSVWTRIDEWNWQTIMIGAFFLSFLLIAKFISKKKKRLFWVSAIAPLVSVILATVFVKFSGADKHGVQTVNHIKKGINPGSVRLLLLSHDYVAKAAKIGVVAGLIGFTEAIAIGRSFAALKDYHIDGNKELVAFGIMNVVGSCTSCYVATGSFSRSAVNYNAGCETALSNIIMSLIVMLTLLVLTPLFHYTPNCILAAIVISAVLNLIDVPAIFSLWKIDKTDFLACIGAFFGVLFISVEYGLLIAVGISLLKLLFYIARPRTVLLGNIPGTSIYRNVEQYSDATRMAGILIIRIDAAIYFCNANYIRERILLWADNEENLLALKGMHLRYLILEMSPVMDIDTTGIHALQELYSAISKRDIQLALANPGAVVLEKLNQVKFIQKIGQEFLFVTVGEAVQECYKLFNKNKC